MEGKALSLHGDVMPVLRPVTSGSQQIAGAAYAHAESTPLNEGIYRLVVRASTDDAGAMIQISTAGDSATTTTGMYLPQGSPEYFFIKQGDIISVVDGSLNITKTV